MKKITLFILTLIAVFISFGAYAKSLYVKTDGNNINDGLSWETAKATIQAGIDATENGDTVLVEYGTYNITESVDFGGKNIKLASDDGTHTTYEDAVTDAEMCIIDADRKYRVFYFHSGGTSDLVVDGFTIRNGRTSLLGGGVYCSNSSPTLTNCTITDNNSADDGGGVYCRHSSPTLINCTITDNTVKWRGGGIYCYSSSPTLTNCTIIGNSATDYGGGVYCKHNSSPTLTNCTITDNSADDGGGVCCRHSSPTLTNCTIADNTGSYNGGGIYCYSSSPTLTNCTITGNSAGNGGGISCKHNSSPTLTNCTITDNSADDGGGVCCRHSSPTLTNCTIADNTADRGGIYCKDNSSPTVTNTIIWGNGPDQIDIYQDSSTIDVIYSDIQGGWEGQGNIDSNPLFGNSYSELKYDLAPDSPCLNAGISEGTASGDILGRPRPNPIGSNPDIGAYEQNEDASLGAEVGYKGIVSLDTTGPPIWSYTLIHEEGSIYEWSYRSPEIGGAEVTGEALSAGWTVKYLDGKRVTFANSTPLKSGSVSGFVIKGLEAGAGSWICGRNTGAIEGPLPVELSSFTASVSTNGVTLSWRTESETSNLGFNVYRSDKKNGNFTKVNTRLIEGQGSSSTPHDYSFTDENVVLDRTYYYYIEDVDFSGEVNKSQIIEVRVELKRPVEPLPEETVLLQNYPNPFNPDTWIPYQLKDATDVTINIYDFSGILVRKLKLGQRQAGFYITKDKAAYWDGRNSFGEEVSSGLYIYHFQAGDYSATKRMLILK